MDREIFIVVALVHLALVFVISQILRLIERRVSIPGLGTEGEAPWSGCDTGTATRRSATIQRTHAMTQGGTPMRICIPAGDNRGLDGPVFGHFGSAPYFVVHDTGTGATEVIENGNQHHAHGGCQPLAAVDGAALDALVVGGIGRRAIARLNEAGTRVYRAVEGTVAANLAKLEGGELEEFSAETACAGHG